MTKAKSDRIAARYPATPLSLEKHKPLSLPDPVLDNFGELSRFRADMTKDGASPANQGHGSLCSVFPELAAIFGQLDCPTCLSLLIAYPGLEYISRAGEGKVAESLRVASRGREGEVLAKALVETAQGSVAVLQKQPAWHSEYPSRETELSL